MIPVPNLDDRTHREIVEEALRLIPFFPRLRCLVIHAPGMTAAPKSLKKLRDIVS